MVLLDTQPTKQWLFCTRAKLNGRVFSQRGDVNWQSRSCDLTPLDFFLWEYLKEKVVIENMSIFFYHRIEVCHRSRGEHLANIVFHT
ncbi:unnamed protein product [Euphydryas editha]|uniref:Uncharacterized protein n=1 Tax=Euphydryas editha TaxID=104508 RepID=A0AAU9TNA9_EUPED|nr:unnamed protein product [Euphydryas editha]